MNKGILILLFAPTLFLATSCGSDSSSNQQFACGTPLAEAELNEFKAPNNPGYKVDELKLLGKLSLAIFDTTGRVKNYDVQFFDNTRQRLVVQVYEMWELTDMDKAACAVFNFKDYILPPETMVIFYQKEKNAPDQHIVLGLRKS